MEPRPELVVRAAQRGFRIDLQVAAEIDQGKQKIAELVLDPRPCRALHCLAQFADLLLDLVEDRRRVSLQSKPTLAAFS